jgi:lactate permease
MFPVNDPAYAMPAHEDDGEKLTAGKAITAWLPFILIFVFLLATSKLIPAIHDPLNLIKSSVLIYDGEGGAPYTFTWVATPGVLIFLAAFIGGAKQGAGFGEMLGVLQKTVYGLRFTILTIISVIATAKVMGYAGMTHEIAEAAVAATGTAYPLIAAFIGSIGTFITGSATSSCVLFGKLQTEAAQAIGATPAAQAWIAAANATGACAGKMISIQSIAIAVAAIKTAGADGKLLAFAAKVYLPFVIAMGLIVYFGQTLVG